MLLWTGIVIAVVLLIMIVLWLRRRSGKRKIASIVLLLREPRIIDAQAVRRAATKAFGVRVGSTPDEENFVVQYTPETMPVSINGLPLGLICAPKPYMDPKPTLEALRELDLRIAKALAEHNASLALRLVGGVT